MSEDIPDGCPACGALPCDWTDNPHLFASEAIRLGLEDAEYLERCAEEADENNWRDWGATMRQAAARIRSLVAISNRKKGKGHD